jgi:hypothetical protein
MTTSIESTKNTLERLLRLEIAAANSYDSAIARLDAPEQQGQLDDLRREHELAASRLRNMLASMHDLEKLPAQRMLGTLVRGISGAFGMLGAPTLLRALRSAERALLGRLEESSVDERLAPEARELITAQLVPPARSHVATLDHLLATVS